MIVPFKDIYIYIYIYALNEKCGRFEIDIRIISFKLSLLIYFSSSQLL